MFRNFLFVGFLALASGCSAPAKVSQKPNIQPVVASNDRTRQQIEATRARLKETRLRMRETRESSERGEDKLKSVEGLLRKLLAE